MKNLFGLQVGRQTIGRSVRRLPLTSLESGEPEGLVRSAGF